MHIDPFVPSLGYNSQGIKKSRSSGCPAFPHSVNSGKGFRRRVRFATRGFFCPAFSLASSTFGL